MLEFFRLINLNVLGNKIIDHYKKYTQKVDRKVR